MNTRNRYPPVYTTMLERNGIAIRPCVGSSARRRMIRRDSILSFILRRIKATLPLSQRFLTFLSSLIGSLASPAATLWRGTQGRRSSRRLRGKHVGRAPRSYRTALPSEARVHGRGARAQDRGEISSVSQIARAPPERDASIADHILYYNEADSDPEVLVEGYRLLREWTHTRSICKVRAICTKSLRVAIHARAKKQQP